MSINPSNIPVVILCGGEGTRFREETQNRPKAMVQIGEYPILWHIMEIYRHFGFNKFILCLGYKGEAIKDYFINYERNIQDLKLDLNNGNVEYLGVPSSLSGSVTFAETGLKAQTGARIKRIQKYIDSEHFMLTYGDGLANVNIRELLQLHLNEGRIGTITGVNSISRFGELGIENGAVTRFIEKPAVQSIINGGFFVFHRDFFDYIDDNESCILEKSPLEGLVNDKQLTLYKHDGFWQCMDTYKDFSMLNDLYAEQSPPPWHHWPGNM